MRCVLRDEEGIVLMALINPEQFYNTHLEVEFTAIFRGLQLCLPLKVRKLQVESDSLIAIQAINEGAESFAQHSTLIKELLEIKAQFQDCKFEYVSRVGNGVTHQLARHVWYVENLHIWGEEFPSFIKPQVWLDASFNQS